LVEYRETVSFLLPAFLTYEKALVRWIRANMRIPRADSYLTPRVEYTGGERAVRAIEALSREMGGKGDARNLRHGTPIITIRMNDVEYLMERYHPPESTWKVVYNGPTPETSTHAARVSKPAPYRVMYGIDIHTMYETDFRYILFNILQKFHHHGGLDYLRFRAPGDSGSRDTRFFPMHFRGASNSTQSETGQEERVVRASMQFELELYLPLPFTFVPVFRRLLLQVCIGPEAQKRQAIASVLGINPADLVASDFLPDRPPGSEDPSPIHTIQPSDMAFVPGLLSDDPDEAALQRKLREVGVVEVRAEKDT